MDIDLTDTRHMAYFVAIYPAIVIQLSKKLTLGKTFPELYN